MVFFYPIRTEVLFAEKGEEGEPLCTNPPYDYMKDADDKKRWIVDREAAEVVKRIFALCLEGYASTQITCILKEEQVITPTIHFMQIERTTRNTPPDNPYNWTGDTIADITQQEERAENIDRFISKVQKYLDCVI